MNKTISDLQQIIENEGIFQFRIVKVEPSGTVTIIGAFDLSYWHVIEIVIKETTYISCPISFDNARFRLATESEKQAIKPDLRTEWNDLIICIVLNEDLNEEPTKHYIFAEEIDFRMGTVYHYKKEELKEGESIADWIS